MGRERVSCRGMCDIQASQKRAEKGTQREPKGSQGAFQKTKTPAERECETKKKKGVARTKCWNPFLINNR